MDDKKKVYTKADFDSYTAAVKREFEKTLYSQRERIAELRKSLSAAERKIAKYESQKELVYKAITTALKKADDIERVSLIKYNQEIAQLKSFHDKWVGYFNRIIEAYPLDEELVAASKVNGKIADILERAGDIEEQYADERERLKDSLDGEFFDDYEDDDELAASDAAAQDDYDEEDEFFEDDADDEEQENTVVSASEPPREEKKEKAVGDDYADRSPSGFSFAEALHPKDDLKDIMRELGIIMDEE